MTEHPNLRNAPITEAAIEFRFQNKIEEFQILESVYSVFEKDFPEKQIIRSSKVDFAFEEDKLATTQAESLSPEGIIFYSVDKKKIIQLQRDSFSFVWVGKYSKWEEFSSEALELWNKADKTLKTNALIRIGSRFINNLNIPQNIELKEIIVNSPTPPEGTSFEMAGFLNQMTLYDDDNSVSAIVCLGLGHNKIKEQKLPVIFDIDVFSLDVIQNENTKINENLNKLRVFKNSIFFKSLTQKGMELYQ